jgi:hypothetical protein
MEANVLQIRVILDAEADVFRDLEVAATANLEELHSAIAQSFQLTPGEMAAFYVSDEEWEQGLEIPLEDFGTGACMKDTTVESVLQEPNDRLIFVYDFLAMWTFFVELVRIKPLEEGVVYPREVMRFGERPDAAPEKDFGGDEKGDLFADAFESDDEDAEEDYYEEEEGY